MTGIRWLAATGQPAARSHENGGQFTVCYELADHELDPGR